MTGRKNRALQVPPVVPYKALEKFPKALYGTTRGTLQCTIFPFCHALIKFIDQRYDYCLIIIRDWSNSIDRGGWDWVE